MNKYMQVHRQELEKISFVLPELAGVIAGMALSGNAIANMVKKKNNNTYENENKDKATTKIFGIDTGITTSANYKKLLDNAQVDREADAISAIGNVGAVLAPVAAAGKIDEYVGKHIIDTNDLKKVLSGTRGKYSTFDHPLYKRTYAARNFIDANNRATDIAKKIFEKVSPGSQNIFDDELMKSTLRDFYRNKTLGKVLKGVRVSAPVAGVLALVGGISGLSSLIANKYRDSMSSQYVSSIKKTAQDNAMQPLFPNGELPYPPTKLQIPGSTGPGHGFNGVKLTPNKEETSVLQNPIARGAAGLYGGMLSGVQTESAPKMSYSDMGDQLLTRIPGGVKAFLKEQEQNYLREYDKGEIEPGEYSPRGRYKKIDVRLADNKQNGESRLVSLPHTMVDPASSGKYVLVNKNKFISSPLLDADSVRDGINRSFGKINNPSTYFGYSDGSDNKIISHINNTEDVTTHELGHVATIPSHPDLYNDWILQGAKNSAKDAIGLVDRVKGFYNGVEPRGVAKTYTSDIPAEKAQGALSTLNAFRDVTGRKLNTKEEVSQLFDEIEKTPSILDKMPAERSRMMRNYLQLKNNGREEEAQDLKKYTIERSPYFAGNSAGRNQAS